VRCRFCGYSFCGGCKLKFQANHDAKICRHYIILMTIAMMELFASGHSELVVAQCPTCQMPYMKHESCEHIRCTTPGCGDFCFKCSCLRAPIIEHWCTWHRPSCQHYFYAETDSEPMRAKCPECTRLGRRCDPPKNLKIRCRFDIDEY